LRAVDLGAKDLRGLKIGRNKYAGLEASTGRLRGDSVGKVSGRRAAHHFEPEVARLSQGNGHNTVFEAECWKADGVVLEKERAAAQSLAQARGLHQWREAGRQRRIVLFGKRQQLFVSPQVGRTAGNLVFADLLANPRQIVGDLERSKAILAERNRLVAPGGLT